MVQFALVGTIGVPLANNATCTNCFKNTITFYFHYILCIIPICKSHSSLRISLALLLVEIFILPKKL